MRRLYRFVFKLPQRKWVGSSSLLIDIKAYSKVFYNYLFYFKSTKDKISICIPMYNRWEMFFEHLLPSLLKLKNRNQIVLSIYDCGSEDFETHSNQLRKIWPGEFVLNTEKTPFSRAVACNRALRQASSPFYFICDTDMSLPENFVHKFFQNVVSNGVWFPLCQWQIAKESENWRWFTEGCGMVGLSDAQLKTLGGLNENFKEWGKEDWDFYFDCYQHKYAAVRTRLPGFYHHWHTSHKPLNFIPVF